MKQITSHNSYMSILDTIKDRIAGINGWNQKWQPHEMPYVKHLQRINWKPVK